MTEGTQVADPTAAGNGSTGTPAEPQPQTVEEVDAFWRNRFSNRDKSHNAEVAALKAQLEQFQSAPKAPDAQAGDGSAGNSRVAELERELAAERSARMAATLAAKYPDAAAALGDDITKLPEERVAAINAVYSGGSAPIIDPNAAPRRAANIPAQKPLEEKSKEELEADLRALAPAYKSMLEQK